MSYGKYRRAALLLATASSVLFSSQAFAAVEADAASASDNSLEELVVTARRREENLQTVPVAATAITGEMLARKNVSTVQELVLTTPSLTTTSVSGSSHVNFSLRGRSAENSTIGNVQPVEVYFAEVPQMAASLAQFYDLASVQVLRGPQGTLFGRASNAGAVLFSPTRPGDAFEGYVSMQVGNLENRELEAAVTVPVIDGLLAVRVAGNIVRREGYTHVLNYDNYDLDDRHSNAFRISAAFTPTSWFRNDLVYDVVDIDQHGPSSTIVAARPGGRVSTVFARSNPTFLTYLAQNPDLAAIPGFAGGFQNYLTTTAATLGPRALYVSQPRDQLIFQHYTQLLSNTAKADFGWATVKYVFGYQHERRAAPFPAFTPFGVLVSYSPPLSPEQVVFKRHQYSNELQLLGTTFDGRLDWIVGGYHQQFDDDLAGNSQSANGFSILVTTATRNPSIQERKTEALFGQATFRLNDRLSVTGGFRRSWDENEITQYSFVSPTNLRGQRTGPAVCRGTTIPASFEAPQCLISTQTIKSSGDNYTLSADYKLTPEIFTYITATKGYRPGGINATSTVPQVREYGTEKIKQYEVGLKAEHTFGDVPTRFNIAAYQQDLTNSLVGLQVFSPIRLSPEAATLNAPKAKVRGVEAELNVIFNEVFRIAAFADYTDAKYTEFSLPIFVADPTGPGGVRQSGSTDVSANPFPNTPKYHFGATGTFTIPTPERVGQVDVSVTYYHQSRFTFSPDIVNEPDAIGPAYDLVNAQVQWRNVFQRPVDLTFFVKNVFGEYYLRGGQGIQSTVGITTAIPSEPRTFGLRLRYRLGAGT